MSILVVAGCASPTESERPPSVDSESQSPVVHGARPAVAFNGTDYLVAWDMQDHRGLYAARVSADGILDPTAFTLATGTATSPAIASDGTDFLVTWHDAQGLHATRVSADGVLLDGSPLLIVARPWEEPWRPTVVASNGESYLVVRWHGDGGRVYATWITPRGDIGSEVMINAGSPTQFAVASDGDEFVVVWSRMNCIAGDGVECSVAEVEVQAVRISADGVMGTPIAIASFTGNPEGAVAVSSDGPDYFIMWTSGNVGPKIVGAFLRPTGVSPSFVIADASARSLHAAFAGESHLVTWTDARDYNTSGYDLYGTTVARDGVSANLGGNVLAMTDGLEHRARLASTGAGYLAVWSEHSRYRGLPTEPPPTTRAYAATIAADGTRTGAPFALAAAPVPACSKGFIREGNECVECTPGETCDVDMTCADGAEGDSCEATGCQTSAPGSSLMALLGAGFAWRRRRR